MNNRINQILMAVSVGIVVGCTPPIPLPAQTADTTAPILAEVTAVPTPSNDNTPSYTFSSDEAGIITYGGDCTSATTSALTGNNTVDFDTLADGTYNDCTITVKDAVNNTSAALTVSAFTIDTIAPSLTQVQPVPNTNDTTPDYLFSNNEAGIITYGGDCTSATTAAIVGLNTVTFSSLAIGFHSNCTVAVHDAAGNVSTPLSIPTFRIVKLKPLNDTGITLCGDYAFGYSFINNNNLNCAAVGSTQTVAGVNGIDPVPAGQDAVFGRDSNGATNSSSDGTLGFSFIKLKADGTQLSNQNLVWNDSGNENDGSKWSCVHDTVTGLVWEAKQNDSGLRDKDWVYTWYNSDATKNAGNPGLPDTGSGAGSDSCLNQARCDTAKYITDVNTAGLCGANDWRMPTQEELMSLVAKNLNNPSIDQGRFPDMKSAYWSATPHAIDTQNAWQVNFTDGGESFSSKLTANSVRLVRNAN